jgi:hypothetical protein
MGHVGDIGGRGKGRWSGEGTRIGPAPTGRGADDGGPGRGRTGERPGLAQGQSTTGSRPALTQEMPAMPSTGSRPGLPPDNAARGTGSRPGLPPDNASRGTGSRPALPAEPREAALFADALTDDRGGKLSKGTETLVMPKVQLPEPKPMTRGGKEFREPPGQRGDKAQTPADTSHEAPEGRTVTTMDTPIGRGGGTRITRMPQAPGGKGEAGEAGETPDISGKPQKGEVGGGSKEFRPGRVKTKEPELPPEPDGFRTPVPTTGTRPALGQGPVKGPVLPLKELIPGGLDKLPNQEGVAKRFASDAALLHQQVRPSELPHGERALRLWAFFAAYAEAAAAHPKTQQGNEVFDKALKEQGFGELHDAHSGEDGLKKAKWVLESSSPQEARQRADDVHLALPPEVQAWEAAQTLPPQSEEAKKPEEQARPRQDSKEKVLPQAKERPALEKVEGRPEMMRVSQQTADGPRPLALPVPGKPQEEEELPPELQRKEGTSWKRLGGNMLWNVLHRFRAAPEDSAIEKEKFSQVATAAILAFVGLMLLVILLVAL